MRVGRAWLAGRSDVLAGAALAVTVFCMVLGSTSVPPLAGPGKKIRWAALLVLTVVALVLAFRERPRAWPERRLGRVLLLAGWFIAVALVSTGWSVDARLTFGRAVSFGVLFVAAGAFALAARTRPGLTPRLLEGILAGAVAAELVGLLLLWLRHGDAVQLATVQNPARFQGLGQNPDTVAMLAGLSTPIAMWTLLRARTRAGQIVAAGSLLLLIGCITASGSRGGLLAAFVGGAVLAAAWPTAVLRRAGLVAAVCVTVLGATLITRIPKPLPSIASANAIPGVTAPKTGPGGKGTGAAAPPVLPLPGTKVGAPEPEYAGRLQDELGRVQPGKRSVFGSSGRLEVWRGAIRQADERPILGYGFGTENKVFVNRYYNFNGEYVENSFIGMYLQLGAVGLLSFLALLAAVGLAAVQAVRRAVLDAPATAMLGVAAAGIALMLVQSYSYSVGNVATVAFWISGFAAASVRAGRPAVAPSPEPRKEHAVVPA